MSAISTTTDFLRLLREDPEFRAQVRQELQIQELMELPEKFAALSSQTQQEFSEIKSRLTRLEAIIAAQQTAITELQDAVTKLQAAITELQDAVTKLQAAITELQAGVAKLQETVAAQQTVITELQETVDRHEVLLTRMDGRLGRLEGAEYERRVSRTFIGVLSRALGGLRHGRLMHSSAYGTIPEFSELMETATDDDKISHSQWYEILLTDAVVRGVKDGETIYAVAEISLTVHQDDIDRAAERAAIIQQATGAATYPIVIGDTIPPQQQAQASNKGVTALIIQQ